MASATFQAIAFAGDLDNLGAMQDAIQDGGGSGDIGDQLAPFLQRPAGGHDRGSCFVPAHDNFEEVLPAAAGLGSFLIPLSSMITRSGFRYRLMASVLSPPIFPSFYPASPSSKINYVDHSISSLPSRR